MSDRSIFDQAVPDLPGADPHATTDGLADQASRAAGLQSELARLVGRAETEDGRVAAGVSSEGLAELEINPRAMKLGSEELAEVIIQIAREAQQDLQRQIQEATKEALGVDLDLDKILADSDEFTSRIGQIEPMMQGTAARAQDTFERIQRDARS